MEILALLALVLGGVALWQALQGGSERARMLSRLDDLEQAVRRLEAHVGAPQATAVAAPAAAVPTVPLFPSPRPVPPVTDFILPPEPSTAPPGPAARPAPFAPPVPHPEPPPSSAEGAAAPGPGREPVSFETRLGQWLGWLAAVTVVLTVGLFIKWTHDIGLLARVPTAAYVGLGWLVGLAFLGVGERFRTSLPLYGQGLTGAGIAALYVATYGGHRYQVLGDTAGSLGLIVVGALAIWLALRQDSPVIGWIGIVLAYASPVLVGGGGSGPTGLFVYLTALNTAVLAVSVARRWTAFRSAAFLCSGGLYAGWYAGKFSPLHADASVLFLLLNWAIFVAVPAAYPLLRKERTHESDLALAALNPLFTGAMLHPVLVQAHPQWTGAAAAFFAAAYWGLSRALRVRRRWDLTEEERDAEEAAPSPPDYLEQLFYAAAVIFAFLAIPLQFHGRTITAAWALMGAALYVSGHRTASTRTQCWAAAPLALAVARLALVDVAAPSGGAPFFGTRGFSFGVVLLSLLAIGAVIAAEWLRSERSDFVRRWALVMLALLVGALFDWWIYLDVPRSWYPAGWAAVAALGIAYGWRLRCRDLRLAGLVLALPPLFLAAAEPAWSGTPGAPGSPLPGWFAALGLCLGLAVLYQHASDETAPERALSPVLGAGACLLLFLRAGLDASAVWLPVTWAMIAFGALLAGRRSGEAGHHAVGVLASLAAVTGLFARLATGHAPDGEWWLRAPGFAATLALCAWITWTHLRSEEERSGEDHGVGAVAAGVGAAVAMTWAATELGRGWLPLALLGVVLVLLWAGVRLQSAALRALAVMGAAALSAEVITRELFLPAGHALLLHSRSAAGIAMVTAWAAAAWTLHRAGGEDERRAVPFLVLAANLHALGWISVEALDLGARLAPGTWAAHAGQFALSAAWLAYAAAAIGYGFWKDRAPIRWGGAALLLLTVAKVYLFDLGILSLGYRVLSFLVLAVVLLSISYLYQRTAASSQRSSRQRAAGSGQ